MTSPLPNPGNGTTPGVNDDLTTLVRGARAFLSEIAKLIQEVGELRVKAHNLTWDNSALMNALSDTTAELEEIRSEQTAFKAWMRTWETRMRGEMGTAEPAEEPLALNETPTTEADATAFANKFLQTLLTTPREWYNDDGRIPPLLDVMEEKEGRKRVHTLTPETAVYYQQFSEVPQSPDGSLTLEEWNSLCQAWAIALPFPFPMIDTEALRVACGLGGPA